MACTDYEKRYRALFVIHSVYWARFVNVCICVSLHAICVSACHVLKHKEPYKRDYILQKEIIGLFCKRAL